MAGANAFCCALLLLVSLFFGLIHWLGFGGAGRFLWEAWLVVTAYAFALFNAGYRERFLGLHFLFLVCFGIFLLSRIFLYLLADDVPFWFVSNYQNYVLAPDEIISILFKLVLSLAGVEFGYFLFGSRRKVDFSQTHFSNLSSDRMVGQFGLLIMLLCFPFAVAKRLTQMQYVRENGYVSLYTTMSSIEFPWYFSGVGAFFSIGFVVFLFSRPRGLLLGLGLALYLVYSGATSSLGSRNQLFLSLIICALIVKNLYASWFRKIPRLVGLGAVVFGFAFLLCVAQFAESMRDRKSISTEPAAMVRNFFYSQGTSIEVLAGLERFGSQLPGKTLPFAFDSLDFVSLSGTQSVQVIEERSALGHQLSYHLNPEKYLSGGNLGTSFVAELADLGILALFAGSVAIGYLLAFFSVEGRLSALQIGMFPVFARWLLISPRGSFLPSYVDLLQVLVALSLLSFILLFRYSCASRWK
jgi:hypothetical protein